MSEILLDSAGQLPGMALIVFLVVVFLRHLKSERIARDRAAGRRLKQLIRIARTAERIAGSLEKLTKHKPD